MSYLLRNIFLLFALFWPNFFLVNVYAFPSSPYFNKIIFFGDSLTDNGNLYRFLLHIIPKSPPYYQGQFSNQEVWAEIVGRYFQEKYGIESENYAVGGETIRYRGVGYLPWTFYESIDNYFLPTHSNRKDYPQTLYIIWLGANDYLDVVDKDIHTYTTQTINDLSFDVRRLINSGARNFLFIDLPDLSKLPYSRLNKNTAILAKLTKLHNIKLENMIKELKNKYNIRIKLFRVSELLNEIMNAPDLNVINKKYNMKITELEKFCWEGPYTLLKDNQDKHTNLNKNIATIVKNNPSLAEAEAIARKAQAGLQPCYNPDNYLFWDKVHPTGVVHQVIAKIIIDKIEQFFNTTMNIDYS